MDLDHLPPKQQVINQNDDGEEDELDFVLSAVHEVMEAGWDIQCGADCISETDIPLQSGCSSSSAFCVAWVQVLAHLSNHVSSSTKLALSPVQIAQMAHRAEVVHFGSPGGTMDHVTSAVGGILRIGPGMWDYMHLDQPREGVWVLADSGQPKDTLGHLKRCKSDRLTILEKLGGDWDNNSEKQHLTSDEIVLLEATRTNRDMERRASTEWNTASGQDLGGWMDEHHRALRDGLLLSTPRIERLREAALQSGAWGFKVVGSGGGGCCVAWTSNETASQVGRAMEDAGAVKTWILSRAFQGAHVTYE